jgi:peptide deformylase
VPVRPLVFYPDPHLRAVAAPVTKFDADLRALAGDLLAMLDAAPAIGLAAPHLGSLYRVMAIRMPDEAAIVYVNPEIVEASDEHGDHREGSVSMPGIQETVSRPARITLRYQDLDGAAHELAANGFFAACLQHEIDQLDGLFWLERLSRLKRDRAIKRFGKTRSASVPA